MRTRHQRQLAEQAGAAPSPQRVLTDGPRPKRTRAQKSTATEHSSQAQPVNQPSSVQPPTSARASRISHRGRPRGTRRAAQPQVATQEDGTETSDASTQLDASAPSDVSTQADGAPGGTREDENGEIPISLFGSATHPVSATSGRPLSVTTQPEPVANVGTPPSGLTTQPVCTFGTPIDSLLVTHPVSAVGTTKPSTPVAQPKSSPSETALLFSQILSSPVTLGTLPSQNGATGTPSGLALVEWPDASPEFTPQEPVTEGRPSPKLSGTQVPHSAARSESAEMASGLSVAQPSYSATPGTLNLPVTRDKPFSVMHTLVNSHPPTTQASGPPSPSQSLAFAIPTEQLPFHWLLACRFNPGMQDLYSHPLVNKIYKESPLTRDLDIEVAVTYAEKKRKRVDDNDIASPDFSNHARNTGASKIRIYPANTSVSGRIMRQHFTKLAVEKRRTVLGESASQAKANESPENNPSPRKRVKTAIQRIPDMYDEDGNLTLGKWKDVVVEVNEAESRTPRVQTPSTSFIENQPPAERNPYVGDEVPESSEQPLQGLFAEAQEQQQPPETPHARGWGLSSFLPSAQTVSKFIPFTSRRAASASGTSLNNKPTFQPPASIQPANEERQEQAPSTPQPLQQQTPWKRKAWTERREQNVDRDAHKESSAPGATAGLARRHHTEKSKKQLLTKGQIKERERLKKEKEEIRAEKERLKQEEARIAQEKKDWEEQRARVEASQAPGTKRKRVPSPDVIPLPPGGGFGLHPDYFTYDSSEEDEVEEDQDTPTKPRPNKKARISSSSQNSIGDPLSATPYEAGHFSLPGQSSVVDNSNVFRKSTAVNLAAADQNDPAAKTSAAPTTFTVPSDSESDDDDDDIEAQSVDGTPTKAVPTHSSVASKESEPSSSAAKASPSKSIAPGTTSDPNSTTRPPSRPWQFIDPVEKARQKVLKHQPKFGSRLRESSRLSSSTVGSDAGPEVLEKPVDEADETAAAAIQYNDSEYDPKRPALPPSIDPGAQPEASLDTAQVAVPNAEDSSAIKQSAPNPEDEIEWAYESFKETMTPKVRAHLDSMPIEDSNVADQAFTAEFEAWKEQRNSEEASGEMIVNANEPDWVPSAYEEENLDAKVRAYIDANFTAEAEVSLSGDYMEGFEAEFQAWKAQEMKKRTLAPSIAA